MFGNCRDCEFFDKLKERDGRVHGDNGGVGNCVIDPPTPQLDRQGKRTMAQFPMVLGKMGCAQFEQKGPV